MDVDVLLRANHAHTFMIAVSALTPIFPFEYLPTADAHWCCNMMGIFFLNLVRALSNHFTYFRPLPSSDNIIWYSAFSRSINFHFEFTFPLELCIIMPQLNWTIINDSYKNGIMYIRTEQQNNERKNGLGTESGHEGWRCTASSSGRDDNWEDRKQQWAVSAVVVKTDVEQQSWWWLVWYDVLVLYLCTCMCAPQFETIVTTPNNVNGKKDNRASTIIARKETSKRRGLAWHGMNAWKNLKIWIVIEIEMEIECCMLLFMMLFSLLLSQLPSSTLSAIAYLDGSLAGWLIGTFTKF